MNCARRLRRQRPHHASMCALGIIGMETGMRTGKQDSAMTDAARCACGHRSGLRTTHMLTPSRLRRTNSCKAESADGNPIPDPNKTTISCLAFET